MKFNCTNQEESDTLSQIYEKFGNQEFTHSNVREIVPHQFFLKKMTVRKYLIQTVRNHYKGATYKFSESAIKKLTGGNA